MQRTMILSLGVLLLWSATAWAGNREDALSKQKEGDRLFSEGSYEEALRAYTEGQKLQDDPTFNLSRASALVKLRRYEEAKAAYELYLSAKRTSKRKSEAKKAIQEIERILATTLICSSEPEGATVFLDSRVDGPFGKTPLTLQLAPGGHRVIVELAGHETHTEIIDIVEGETRSIKPVLSPSPFTLEIVSEPAAKVLVNDEVRGDTPLVLELSAATYTIGLEAKGYQNQTKQIEARPGEKLSWEATLSEAPTTLKLSLTPKEAKVLIEGQAGSYAAGALPLPPGRYQLTARAKGYYDLSAEVVLARGESSSLDLALKPISSSLSVSANLPGARLFIDEKESGAVTGDVVELPAGAHTLRVEALGLSAYQKEIQLRPGELLTAEIELRPPRTPKTYLLIGTSFASGVVALISGIAFLDTARKFSRGELRSRSALLGPALVSDLSLGVSISAAIWGIRNLKKQGPSRGSFSSQVKEKRP